MQYFKCEGDCAPKSCLFAYKCPVGFIYAGCPFLKSGVNIIKRTPLTAKEFINELKKE